MGRERPLYFIPRYEIVGDKQAGMKQNKEKVFNKKLSDQLS
jgi:hypothetical protein